MSKPYNRKDSFFNEAQEQGYRSRAAFKLLEIQEKFKVIRSNDYVVDLGCWPGSWLQVFSKIVGAKGKVVGIDIVETEPLGLDNTILITENVNNAFIFELLYSNLGGKKADVLASDMSPKLTGIREKDEYETLVCAERAMHIAHKILRSQGNLIIKLFKNEASSQFCKKYGSSFKNFQRAELKSTRTTSNEFYFIGKGFKAHG
jgi:23S rRNA (uridine2552-2'-O)-methyltransferase